MTNEHTAEVIAAVYELINTKLDGNSPLTIAAAHIGTSFSTLKRRLRKGSLSMNDYESLVNLVGLDPKEVYSHPESILGDVQNEEEERL
jgi:hypothetical protein